ncbi:hypothetical protein CBR_g41774 [Chara braunii]|uniref:Uncharacterized protein n=1 Tax=Chara braunii TaxID=69332 RepID=A0A388LWK5_CHABU|nr:hypothetical protein CBR_g41774 [Chara braunii]|eukprot:GBG86710.1 hypothetical protein CBR_g41774 [Chara braunii]
MNAGLRVVSDRSRSKSRKGTGTFSGYGGRIEEDRCSENQVGRDECADERNCVASSSSSSLLSFAQRPDTWQYMLAQLPLADLGKNAVLAQLSLGILVNIHIILTVAVLSAEVGAGKQMPQLCRTIAEGAPFDNPCLPFWRWMVMERAPGAVLLREFWNHETHLVQVWKGLLDKMNQELLGLAQKPWRDLLQR